MNLFVHVDWVVHVYARFRRKRAFCDAAKRKFLFVLFIFAFLANAELTVDSFTDPLMRPVESSSYEEYMQYYNATAGEGAAYFQSLDATAKIETNPAARTVKVETSASQAALRQVLEEAGYPAASN